MSQKVMGKLNGLPIPGSNPVSIVTIIYFIAPVNIAMVTISLIMTRMTATWIVMTSTKNIVMTSKIM